ncbi:MAG TPA: YHS domain-containing protein [Candidatus Bathyarchaeia archaeon]|nr:YHS domain-containing protein [Candidatus Bathyarchaeia archaeon]
MSTVKDPVCGMTVDEKTAAHKTIHDNKVYYFCSSTCQTEFVKDPDKYLQQTSTAGRHAGHYGGYCGSSGCGPPARGVAWYLYLGLLLLLLLTLLLAR